MIVDATQVFALKRARQLLATSGWSGPEADPLCLATGGRHCFEYDEGVRTFSVMGALIETGAWPEGWHTIEAVVSPAHAALNRFEADVEKVTPAQVREFHRLCKLAVGEPDLQTWLQVPERTNGEVLRAFVRAIERSKKTGERR